MSPTTCEFNWENLSLSVPDGILHHVADVDPELEWKKMGLKSHAKDTDAANALDQAAQQAEEFLKTEEGQAELNRFLQSSISLFQDLASDRNALKSHFPETEFIFVVGPIRTGGTYLLNELIRLLNMDRTDYHHRLIGDGMPALKHCMFWNVPSNYITCLFQIAQYLQWVKEEWPRNDYVVKKRNSFGYCLPLLDEIFGEQARYLITIRHPGGISESSDDFFETHGDGDSRADRGWDLLLNHRFGESTDNWENLSHDERVLRYWKTYFVDVGTTKDMRGELTPVVFNEDSERVVRDIANEWEVAHDPEAFTPSDRSFGNYWDSDEVENAFDSVRSAWAVHDRPWPELPRL